MSLNERILDLFSIPGSLLHDVDHTDLSDEREGDIIREYTSLWDSFIDSNFRSKTDLSISQYVQRFKQLKDQIDHTDELVSEDLKSYEGPSDLLRITVIEHQLISDLEKETAILHRLTGNLSRPEFNPSSNRLIVDYEDLQTSLANEHLFNSFCEIRLSDKNLASLLIKPIWQNKEDCPEVPISTTTVLDSSETPCLPRKILCDYNFSDFRVNKLHFSGGNVSSYLHNCLRLGALAQTPVVCLLSLLLHIFSTTSLYRRLAHLRTRYSIDWRNVRSDQTISTKQLGILFIPTTLIHPADPTFITAWLQFHPFDPFQIHLVELSPSEHIAESNESNDSYTLSNNKKTFRDQLFRLVSEFSPPFSLANRTRDGVFSDIAADAYLEEWCSELQDFLARSIH